MTRQLIIYLVFGYRMPCPSMVIPEVVRLELEIMHDTTGQLRTFLSSDLILFRNIHGHKSSVRNAWRP